VSTFADFGRYLSQQRELRGLSREDIAKATRIPPTLVAALEDGVADRLPERVFVVNYVRSYATAVGLSPDEAVNRFHEIPGTLAPTEASPVILEAARRKRAFVVLGVLALVFAVAGLLLWLWTRAQLDASFIGHVK
jgi:cytoskeletal protein RodZ